MSLKAFNTRRAASDFQRKIRQSGYSAILDSWDDGRYFVIYPDTVPKSLVTRIVKRIHKVKKSDILKKLRDT